MPKVQHEGNKLMLSLLDWLHVSTAGDSCFSFPQLGAWLPVLVMLWFSFDCDVEKLCLLTNIAYTSLVDSWLLSVQQRQQKWQERWVELMQQQRGLILNTSVMQSHISALRTVLNPLMPTVVISVQL